MIAKIATGKIDDMPPADDKDPAAKALGKKGGAARDHMTLTKMARIVVAKRLVEHLRPISTYPIVNPNLIDPQSPMS